MEWGRMMMMELAIKKYWSDISTEHKIENIKNKKENISHHYIIVVA